MRILVTSGATREPIDDVRFVSNVSTGSTGAALADAFAAAGHEVVLLRGHSAVAACHPGIVTGVFGSAEDLGHRLRAALADGSFDVVVQAAAVADYRPASPAGGKLSSHAGSLDLRLVPTPKLLPSIKAWSPRQLRVVGFKLTAGADAPARAAAVAKLFSAGGTDLVVHNDLDELASAGSARRFRIYPKSGYDSPSAEILGVPALAAWLESWLRSA